MRGDHTFTAGADITRRQINGSESIQERGAFQFSNNFGRDVITNLRWGTPTRYIFGIGNPNRGFRDWLTHFYVGDTWQVNPVFTLTAGLRYEPQARPTEVNSLSEVEYSSDLNNFAPQFGLAYQLPQAWGVLRANYGLHYGEIFLPTFLQSRLNPPNSLISINDPDLVDPRGVSGDKQRSSIYQFAPDLSTPYTHLYSFTWELELPNAWTLDLGYVGSRSHRLLLTWMLNRARVVPGIDQVTGTVDQRRPDSSYADIYHIHNGSRGYYDAARITLRVPYWKGLSVEGSYWFSKAIDLGSDYTGTAAGRDVFRSQAPSEFGGQDSMRGLSNFDQPHATLWNVAYETPGMAGRHHWLRRLLGSWQLSSVFLVKTGTPFSIRAGSDSPGYGNVDGVTGDVPNLLDPSILGRSIDHPDTSQQLLPRSAFEFIGATDSAGNLGHNTFRKDGVFNINMGLARSWNLTGEKSLMFRAESLNLFNHPQFDRPGRSLTSDDFGVITNTLNDGRAFRFMLRLSF